MDIPEFYEPVLAKIEDIGSLGKFTYYEVVMHNGDMWMSFKGSNTFEDGEKVIKWVYADEAIGDKE